MYWTSAIQQEMPILSLSIMAFGFAWSSFPLMPRENIRQIRVALRWYKFSEVEFKISISHSFKRFFFKLSLFYRQWEMSGGETYMYSLLLPSSSPLSHVVPWKLLSLSTNNKRAVGSSLLRLGVRATLRPWLMAPSFLHRMWGATYCP